MATHLGTPQWLLTVRATVRSRKDYGELQPNHNSQHAQIAKNQPFSSPYYPAMPHQGVSLR